MCLSDVLSSHWSDMIKFSVNKSLYVHFGEWFGGEAIMDTGGPVVQKIDYDSLD